MKETPNIPKKGMKFNKYPSELSPGEYTLLYNGNIANVDGDTVLIQKEQSNILCSNFKQGYKVIGILPINVLNKTIFFLISATSSEIGYIDAVFPTDIEDSEGVCNDCNKPLIETKQLEDITQYPVCRYNTIINADCLNFHIDFPISATYEIGVDVTTTLPNCENLTIFFTDDRNPRRYVNIDNIPTTLLGYTDDCKQPVYTSELDCDAIKVVKQYKQPCINTVDVVSGGDNLAGVYQFALAYSNVNGDNLTDYSVVTNPISLSSTSRVITIATDYNTNKSIKIEVDNIDTQFNYFNLVVLKTINSTTSPFLIGTFPITSLNFQYTYTGNNYATETRLSIEEVVRKRPVYEYAKGVTKANNHLFWWDLKEQKQINLQPVVKDIPLKWQTVEAEEGFYSNPLSSNFVSFERDEVYPFGIEFKLTNGYVLPTFAFVAKDEDYYRDVYNIDVRQIQTGDNVLSSDGCSPEPLNELWQVYNTAPNPSGSPCYEEDGFNTVTRYEQLSCFSEYWNDGDTPVEPCCNPSGNSNPNDPDYCECILLETPSGSVEQPVIECIDLAIPEAPPPYNFSYADESCPCPSGFDNTFSYIPPNTQCVTAKELYPTLDNTCNEDIPCLCGESTIIQTLPYIYLNTLSPDPDDITCNNTTLTPTTNSNWFSFSALSTYHQIRVVTTTNVVVKVYEGSCASLTPLINLDGSDACNSGEDTVCITIDNLIEGDVYFIQVAGIDAIGGTGVGYGVICINTPQPSSYNTIDIPARYRWECIYNGDSYTVDVYNDTTCFTQPYEFGDFAYWESTETYPNLPDIWGDLCGKPIRHFKFPDCCVSHIHNSVSNNAEKGQKNRIYPIGVKIDINDIKQALTNAVEQGLITNDEKNQITSFSIKRGNRRNNRSIIAKGLMYDVWKTPLLDSDGDVLDGVLTYQYFSNFPYNDLNDNLYLKSSASSGFIKHPYYNRNYINNRYTFHSPNVHFDKPELGTELKLETIEYGKFFGDTSRVENHAEYVILTPLGVSASKGLASGQILFEAVGTASASQSPVTVVGTGSALLGYAINFALAVAAGFATNFGKYTTEWIDILKGIGTPFNPAVYHTSIGFYNNYCCVPSQSNISKRRTISNGRYLNTGNYSFTENGEFIKFNNFQRESSVYLSVADDSNTKFFQSTNSMCNLLPDYSRFGGACQINKPLENAASGDPAGVKSFYASIKNYKADQYGTIDSIEWLDTGYCGTIDWENETPSGDCTTIFGGDTYINRFALKRKFPYFIQDRVGQAENSDVMYSQLGNVGFPRYWFNSLQSPPEEDSFKPPSIKAPRTDFACVNPDIPLYRNGVIYLYEYGVPYFICESDYNVDLRHGENEGDYKDFYPHVGDIVEWTQQYKNPISFDNTFYYNRDYSKQNRENFYYILPNSFEQDLRECRAEFPNRLIYSAQGAQNWLEYLSEDKFDFPLEDGRLIGVNAIEQQAVVVRQENATSVFNAFITVESSLATIAITAGQMFNQKPRQYYKTDLGLGGSTNYAFTSTPFGHFYIDTQNPSVFQLTGDALRDITRDSETNTKIQWFINNLPFQISKDFPEVDVDNNFKYFGISMLWDNRYERLFITKKDYKLLPEYKNKLDYIDGNFYHNTKLILPTNTEYFCDKSWTIAYSPLLKEWISFYSFKPNYYIPNETFFSSGINYPNASLHNHLQTNKSFGVFYGEKYPFILEYGIASPLNNSVLNSIQYQAEVRRYRDNDLNYSVINDSTYTKFIIHNQNQSTGEMNLEVREKNNLQQLLKLTKLPFSQETSLVENIENYWKFNNFSDKSLNNGQPLLKYYCDPTIKEVNNLSITNQPTYLQNSLRSDFFLLRLIDDEHTNYNFLHKFSIAQKTDILL
jgi:hypothetical protein